MKTFFILAFFISLTGCYNVSESPEAPIEKLADVSYPPPQSPQEKPADMSHTPSQALELGAPSIDKIWTEFDYIAFDAYLTLLPHAHYPRVDSPNSSPLFMKAIDSVEQPMFVNHDYHVNARYEQLMEMMVSTTNILDLYVRAYTTGIDYSKELANLYGFIMIMDRQHLILLDEFIANIESPDVQQEVRTLGLEKVKDGIAMQLEGFAESMKESYGYANEERLIIAKNLAAEMPIILPYMNQSVQREFEIKINKFISAEKNNEIKKLLSQIFSSEENQISN